jgi:hypothetical protein
VAALGAAVLGEWAVAVPLLFLLLGRGPGTPWGVLCYYWAFQSGWLLLLVAPPERSLLWALLALGLWIFRPDQVDAVWRALWAPTVQPGGKAHGR